MVASIARQPGAADRNNGQRWRGGIETAWWQLDNAAKLYPAKMNADDTCVFRVYAILKEVVRPEVLQQSVLDLKRRFPTLYVKLRNGFFWNYYEPNERDLLVRPEKAEIAGLLDGHRNNGYLFSVQYCGRRVSVEAFHALGDGSTALTYLNALIFRYLTLLGHVIDPMGKIATCDQEPTAAETEDSYTKYYTGMQKRDAAAIDALRVKGTQFAAPGNCGVLHGLMESDKLVQAAHRSNTTVTKYLTALLIRAVWLAADDDRCRYPICVNMPINMRKMMPSVTLRNFSLYFTVHMPVMETLLPFEDIVSCVDREFAHYARLPVLQQLLNANVAVEKSKWIALLPLPIKRLAINAVSRLISGNHLTTSLSSLGQIDLPEGMARHVEYYGLIPPLGKDMPLDVSVVSSCGKTEITFMRNIRETNVERRFFSALTRRGVPVELTTNLPE